MLFQPKRLMILGGAMLIVSWLVIFAMVLEILPAPLFLYIISYAVSASGLVVGTIGLFTQIRIELKKHKDDEWE